MQPNLLILYFTASTLHYPVQEIFTYHKIMKIFFYVIFQKFFGFTFRSIIHLELIFHLVSRSTFFPIWTSCPYIKMKLSYSPRLQCHPCKHCSVCICVFMSELPVQLLWSVCLSFCLLHTVVITVALKDLIPSNKSFLSCFSSLSV